MEEYDHLILASHSPRRKELLELLGIPFRVIPGRGETKTWNAKSPVELVENNSLAKAKEVALAHRGNWVIGADTIVVFERYTLGKPEDEKEALEMLLMLSGKTHRVITGVSLINEGSAYSRTLHDMTKVTFHNFSREEAVAYIHTGEPKDKAGAYGAQGAGSALIERLEGSYTNVVGLPLSMTIGMLKEADILEVSTVRGRMYQLKNLP